MFPSRVGVPLFVTLSLLGVCEGQDYNHRNYYGKAAPLPDLALPKELAGLEGFSDLTGGPKGGAGFDFKPEGVVQGMMMGDVIRRIENLEILCQANLGTGTPRPTPRTLNTETGDGVELNALPEDPTLGIPDHVVVPGPETEGKGYAPTPQQLQKTMDMIQDSMLLVASEQDKLREEFSHVLSEVTAAKQEVANVKLGLNQTRSEMKSAVQRADLNLKVQGTRLETLSSNVTNIDMSLSAFHNSFYDLSKLNRSLLVARKEQHHTNRKLTVLTTDVKSLKKDVNTLQTNWNKTMKEASRRLERSYTVGKDVNKLQKQFHSMKARVVKIHKMKCESGRILFMNYPFSFGKWPQTRVIKFREPFPERPELTYGMTQLDVNYRYNTRARVRVLKLTPESFSLACDGWYNTRLYRVEVSWMACNA